MIPRLRERARDFHTSHWAAGERHHSLSFSSLWKSIISFHVLIHMSPCLPGEMPEAQICIRLNWIKRFWILCLTPPRRFKKYWINKMAGLIFGNNSTRGVVRDALERSMSPPFGDYRNTIINLGTQQLGEFSFWKVKIKCLFYTQITLRFSKNKHREKKCK